jgi:hypothetical protein
VLFRTCVANTDCFLFYFIILVRSLYLIFSDLPVCPTYALLHSARVSIYIPDVSYLSDFGVMLIKLLILFVVLCAIFMFVYSDHLVISRM